MHCKHEKCSGEVTHEYVMAVIPASIELCEVHFSLWSQYRENLLGKFREYVKR